MRTMALHQAPKHKNILASVPDSLIRTSGGLEVSTEVLSPSQEKSIHPFSPQFHLSITHVISGTSPRKPAGKSESSRMLFLPNHTRIGQLLCQSHRVPAQDWFSCLRPTPQRHDFQTKDFTLLQHVTLANRHRSEPSWERWKSPLI